MVKATLYAKLLLLIVESRRTRVEKQKAQNVGTTKEILTSYAFKSEGNEGPDRW